MALETIPIQFFTYSTEYPESGQRIQLGNSYEFTVEPDGPDQRTFKLRCPGMIYDENATGRDMYALEAFYQRHRQALPFKFEHPIYGTVTCKFKNPLKVPEGFARGGGVLQEVEIELIEQP